MRNLDRKRIAILATDGFEESELSEPKKALEEAGAEVHIISEHTGTIKSWSNGNWSNEYSVDKTLDNAHASDYHSLMIPGGVINPDKLRRNPDAIEFTKEFFTSHKPVSSICHGPQLLIEADVLNDRTITSFPSIKKDVMNAGAKWVDEEVVVDEGLTTSRSPEDMNAFIGKMIEEIAEGKHEEQTA